MPWGAGGAHDPHTGSASSAQTQTRVCTACRQGQQPSPSAPPPSGKDAVSLQRSTGEPLGVNPGRLPWAAGARVTPCPRSALFWAGWFRAGGQEVPRGPGRPLCVCEGALRE